MLRRNMNSDVRMGVKLGLYKSLYLQFFFVASAVRQRWEKISMKIGPILLPCLL